MKTLSLWYLLISISEVSANIKLVELEICSLLIVIFFFQVLQVLTEESTPSADLIGAVKHLYYTKLKVK